MDGFSQRYSMVIIQLIGSFVIFLRIHLKDVFYNRVIEKLWSMMVSINLWAAILLCSSLFLEGIIIHGTIYAWISGIPLIILIVGRSEKYKYSLLLMDVNTETNPTKILDLLHHLLRLYHN
jgi:hypothetical protein